ncbi:MAG TPA: 6,7-dimethyl-8-ribityllumazine synthase [Gaiellaceae bacterium]
MSDNLDESQDWPLRDYSARLRPPRSAEEPAEAAQEPEPEPEPTSDPEPEETFDPPPTSSAGVEVLYDEDEEQPRAPAGTQDETALQGQTPEGSAPDDTPDEPALDTPDDPALEGQTREGSVPADTPDEAVPQGQTPEGSVPEETSVPTETDEEPESSEAQHAEGDLRIPDGISVLEGAPEGNRRTVAIVVSKFNGEITGRLLDSAMTALDDAGVSRDAVLVMPVPGAFELPIAAMALAKTRRYSCVIALGCVIRGETPHFDFVASEAASGLQLAGIETGVPVSFGLLTCDTAEQAEERVERGGWAARTALEMADAFAQLRTAVARG